VELNVSAHARKRLLERGITEHDLTSALSRRIGAPGPGEPGTLWIRGYAAGGRILRVCVDAADQTRIITAAWPS